MTTFLDKMDRSFYLICDNLRSLQNIGSIFRTADALAVDKIYLTGICGCPPHPKISKTALGAEKAVPWEHDWQIWRLVDKLKREKIKIVVLEQTKQSIDYRRFKPDFPLALVIGNEVKGVSPSVLKRADQIIKLPMLGKKESLNVAVSFGIIGYYLRYGG